MDARQRWAWPKLVHPRKLLRSSLHGRSYSASVNADVPRRQLLTDMNVSNGRAFAVQVRAPTCASRRERNPETTAKGATRPSTDAALSHGRSNVGSAQTTDLR